MTSTHTHQRPTVVGRMSNGQPRSYRLARPQSSEAAYRRLAAAILGLDVQTLSVALRHARDSAQPGTALALERAA